MKRYTERDKTRFDHAWEIRQACARKATRENAADRGQRRYFVIGIEAPPAGFEPAHPAPEAGALSPELWGLDDSEGYQSRTIGRDRPVSLRITLPNTIASPT